MENLSQDIMFQSQLIQLTNYIDFYLQTDRHSNVITTARYNRPHLTKTPVNYFLFRALSPRAMVSVVSI